MHTISQILSSAVDKLQARKEFLQKEQGNQAFIAADMLLQVAEERFETLCSEMKLALAETDQPVACTVRSSDNKSIHYYQRQVHLTAAHFSYQADVKTHRAWVRLRIEGERHVDVIVFFHCLGPTFTSLMVASAFLQFIDVVNGQRRPATETIPLGVAPFRFTGREEEKNLTTKFGDWLNSILAQALTMWRDQL